MRNLRFTLILTLLCLFSYLLPSYGQLPKRSDLLAKKYDKDRTRGIVALNKRYIGALKKELDIALSGGKLIEFPHNNDASKKAYLAFYEDGKGAYLGSKDQSIAREYKPTGKTREFIITWPGRQDDFNTYLITISPDGKSATLVLRYNNKTSPRVIQDAD
jgi:hypothetical protein|tara:strand:- start:922 stop:1401 length:480 start_codon:yes stop_codon:yes gene_type:complete